MDGVIVRSAMRYSTLDGIFAVQYTTLTTGTLLIGFLLALGASASEIGLVAMLPLLGGLLQPVGAALVKWQNGWRKTVTVAGVIIDDLLWSAVLTIVALLPSEKVVTGIIGILIIQQTVTAFSLVSWTSWISDLIPGTLRGRFFGKRNFICNALGAISAVLAGQFIERIGHNAIWSFGVVIVIAMISRLLSAFFLTRQPEPFPEEPSGMHFVKQMSMPFRDQNYRKYLNFSLIWGLGVQIASPFFTVYMIRDLNIDFGTVTIFAGITTFANLFGQKYWGPLCDRFGNKAVMRATGILIVTLPFWWLFASGSGPGFYLIGFLSAFGGFAWAGYLLANGNFMMVLAPGAGKTSFFAMQAAVAGLFGAIGTLSGGLLVDNLFNKIPDVAFWLPRGIPMLFFISFVIRLIAWFNLRRIDEPARKPQMQVTYLIRDAVRTFNIIQGFSPLLHIPANLRDKRKGIIRRAPHKIKKKNSDANEY